MTSLIISCSKSELEYIVYFTEEIQRLEFAHISNRTKYISQTKTTIAYMRSHVLCVCTGCMLLFRLLCKCVCFETLCLAACLSLYLVFVNLYCLSCLFCLAYRMFLIVLRKMGFVTGDLIVGPSAVFLEPSEYCLLETIGSHFVNSHT